MKKRQIKEKWFDRLRSETFGNTEIFKVEKLREGLKVKPIRKPLSASKRRYSNYSKIKAHEYIKIVNESFGDCPHPLGPFDFVRLKLAGEEPKNWRCEYLKEFIDMNIDFT